LPGEQFLLIGCFKLHDVRCEKKTKNKMAALSREDAFASALNFFPLFDFLKDKQKD